MTTKEAIKIINCWTRCTDFERNEARHLAIEALNTQIPQRCDESDDGIYCPVCGARMAGDWNYCPSCGQRLE